MSHLVFEKFLKQEYQFTLLVSQHVYWKIHNDNHSLSVTCPYTETKNYFPDLLGRLR